MRRFFLTATLLCSTLALAKPWNGIEPGVSTRDEVVAKFGNPTKAVKGGDGKEILAYLKDQAIKGTDPGAVQGRPGDRRRSSASTSSPGR